MDETQARQCGHKLKYTEDEARAAAKAMHKKHHAKYTVYKCNYGDHYHVGTVRSPEAAQRRAARRGV